jgi:hypothetical protein
MGVSESCYVSDPKQFCGLAHVYDLRVGSASSHDFYNDVARFSDQVVDLVEKRAGAILGRYREHAQSTSAELKRSRAEHAIDLLLLGMILHRYEGVSKQTSMWIMRLADGLVWAREHLPALKPLVDSARSRITTQLLSPTAANETDHFDTAVMRLDRLMAWLHATGEFKQELARLRIWRTYIVRLDPREATSTFEVVCDLFDVFGRDAEKVLGAYTHGVEPFLQQQGFEHKYREDFILRSKRPVEYHLNIVAAEVMNQGLREEFEQTRARIVLVPACMRGEKSQGCKAKIRGLDIRCAGCDPECAVNRISQKMRAVGMQVYIVPHASGFSGWLKRWENTGVGITAAACLLHILPGGYEMRSRCIPSQCIPLDFPGCKRHWDRIGFPTALNENRLVRIAVRQSHLES